MSLVRVSKYPEVVYEYLVNENGKRIYVTAKLEKLDKFPDLEVRQLRIKEELVGLWNIHH